MRVATSLIRQGGQVQARQGSCGGGAAWVFTWPRGHQREHQKQLHELQASCDSITNITSTCLKNYIKTHHSPNLFSPKNTFKTALTTHTSSLKKAAFTPHCSFLPRLQPLPITPSKTSIRHCMSSASSTLIRTMADRDVLPDTYVQFNLFHLIHLIHLTP